MCICVSYLCFDSYHCCTAYHSEFSVCVFYFYTFLNIFSVIVLYVCLSVLFYGPRCLKLKLMMMMMMMMIACAAGSMIRSSVCLSVRASVRLSVSRSTAAAVADGFAAGCPAGIRYRSTAAGAGAAYQLHASSAATAPQPGALQQCGQCRVDSRGTRLNTELLTNTVSTSPRY